MIMILRLSLMIFIAALLSGCGVQGTVEGRVADAHARNDGPPVWVVKDFDSTLYLFGTVHLLPTDSGSWMRDDLKEIFDKSGTVFFEADSSRDGQVKASVLTHELGFYSSGERLSDGFDRYQLRLLEAAALSSDLPLAALENMKPWFAAEVITLAAAEKEGLSADISADEALKSRATRLRKNVQYLDTIESQIRASSDQPNFVQDIIITDTLEGYNSIGGNLRRAAEDWAVGRISFLAQNVKETKSRSPELYQSLFTDRNIKWSKTLTRHMEDSGTSFAAIGIGHMLGDDSLIKHLKNSGYEVKRYYAFQGDPVINIINLPEN